MSRREGYAKIEIDYAEACVIRDDAQDKAAALNADLEATMRINDLEARRCASTHPEERVLPRPRRQDAGRRRVSTSGLRL